MSATWLLVLLVLLAGAAIAAQAGVNATLGRHVGDPTLAALISFAVGTAVLTAVVAWRHPPMPAGAAFAAIPWWAWTGGVLGAFFVTVAVFVAPRLGAATLVTLIVAAQLAAALVLDHFGWLGFPERAISWQRVAGVALLASGALLVRLY